MKKHLFYPFYLLLGVYMCFSANINAQTDAPRVNRDHAVFFAISDYKNASLPARPNSVQDAKAIAEVLESRFGFDTEVLGNLTFEEISRKISQLQWFYRGNADGKHPCEGQLFLFFSGRTALDQWGNSMFPGSDFQEPAILSFNGHPYNILNSCLSRINCRHMLVVIDAPYAQKFIRAKEEYPLEVIEHWGTMKNSRPDPKRPDSFTSRIFFTSDNQESRASDTSTFSQKLLEALRSAKTHNGIITDRQISSDYLALAVPKPYCTTFEEHEAGGSFIFYDIDWQKKNGLAPDPIVLADRKAHNKAMSADNPEFCRQYLINFPEGKYRKEIQEKMVALTLSNDGMIFIKGGTFMMGCDEQQMDCDPNEAPVHKVTVSDFYLGQYEVTQKVWQDIMGVNPSFEDKCEMCPVNNFSWSELQVFLKKLNAKYPGRNYRLPTEAEWEYAAREGGRNVLFGNGKNISDTKEINCGGNNDYFTIYSIPGEVRWKTVPVGTLPPSNALGLYDMSGNVSEICSDWFGKYSAEPQINPTGKKEGVDRVVRGGSYLSHPSYCRVTFRGLSDLLSGNSNTGIRLARSK